MNKAEILARWRKERYIYGYMYGRKLEDERLNKILEISKDKLYIWDEGLCYMWGWPGPDYNLYRYEDYGKTWAFTRREIVEG